MRAPNEGGRPRGWIGVDLDGTLARYDGWRADGSVGAPVPRMVARVKQKLAEGWEVRIVTARVAPTEAVLTVAPEGINKAVEVQRQIIQAWCREHLGQALPVQCHKDYAMVELWDDRARQVIPNTGEFLDERAVVFDRSPNEK